MIRRAQHKKNFTTVHNEFINDTRLSARAKGVMIWLLSKPDHWIIRREHLYKCFKEGRTAVWTAFKELIEYGYIVEEEFKRGDGGKLQGGKSYVVYEISKHSNNFSLLYPAEKPDAESRRFGGIVSTDSIANTEIQKKENTDYSKGNFLFFVEELTQGRNIPLTELNQSMIEQLQQHFNYELSQSTTELERNLPF